MKVVTALFACFLLSGLGVSMPSYSQTSDLPPEGTTWERRSGTTNAYLSIGTYKPGEKPGETIVEGFYKSCRGACPDSGKGNKIVGTTDKNNPGKIKFVRGDLILDLTWNGRNLVGSVSNSTNSPSTAEFNKVSPL